MLFDPASHEPLTERPWDVRRARAAIAAVVADAERAFDADSLWPAHPLDLEDGPLSRVASLYLGASGVIWALQRLERAGAAELRRDWSPVAVGLVERYASPPGLPGRRRRAGPVASDGGGRDPPRRAHACARRLAGGAAARGGAGERREPVPGADVGLAGNDDRRAGAVRANGRRALARGMAATLRISCGRSGTTSSGFRSSTGGRVRYLGPAHGFAGNVFALARGDLLDSARRAEARTARDRDGSQVRPACRRALPSGRRRLEPPGTAAGDSHPVVPRRTRDRRLARLTRSARRAADGTAARRW